MAGTNVATLTAKLTADTSGLRRGLADAERQVKGFGSRSSAMFKAVGVAAVAGVAVAGAAIAAVGVKGVMAFASFEKGMNEVFTLLPGISAEAMGKMQDDVLALSNRMGVLPEETIPALYQALSAGVPKDNVFEFMEQANKLAIGGVAELDESVSALTGVMNAYTDGSVTAAAASDMMFTTVKNGVTTIPELAATLGEVTPIAAALGIGFDEISAAMATSTKVTQNTSKSAVGLKNMLAELGKEGTIASKMFEDAAGKSFPEFIAAGGDLSDVMKLMQGHADDNNLSMLDMFGSIEAGQEALRLASGGAAELDAQLVNVRDSTGATQEAFNTMDKGLSRSWDKIKTTMSTALIKIGKKLAPFAEKAAAWLGEKLPDAINWLVRTFEDMKPTFDMVALWLGEMIPRAIRWLNKAWGTIRNAVSTVWDTLEGPINDFIDWFKSIDWEGIWATIVDGWETIKNWWDDIWPKVQTDLKEGGDDLAEGWDSIWESLDVSWEDFSSAFSMLWWQFWRDITRVPGEAFAIISGVFGAFSGVFTWLWERFGNTISEFFGGVLGGIVEIWDGTWELVGGIWDTFAGLFTGDWTRMWGGLGAIFTGAWGIFVGLFLIAWTLFSTPWKLLWDLVGPVVEGVISSLYSDFFKPAWDGFLSSAATVLSPFADWIASSMAPGMGVLAYIFSPVATAWAITWAGIRNDVVGKVNPIIEAINVLIGAINAIPGVPDIPIIPKLSMTKEGGALSKALSPKMATSSTYGGFTLFSGHAGGIVPGPIGSDVPAILQAGERIIPMNEVGGGLTIIVEGNLFGATSVDELAEIITTAQVGQTRRGVLV